MRILDAVRNAARGPRPSLGRVGLLLLLCVAVAASAGPLLGWGGGASTDSSIRVDAATASALAGKLVIVDPGHGGRDPGALAGGVEEKDIVLAVGLILRGLLEQAGAAVVMTRSEDVDLSQPIPGQKKRTDLLARAALVEETRPDAMLSIHANSFGSSRWRGAQVFYNEKDHRNEQLARAIQTELTAVTGVNRAVAKDRHQFLLKVVEVPTVCVEVGFLTSPEDLKMLQDPIEQRRLAWAICRGLAAWLRESLRPASSPP